MKSIFTWNILLLFIRFTRTHTHTFRVFYNNKCVASFLEGQIISIWCLRVYYNKSSKGSRIRFED